MLHAWIIITLQNTFHGSAHSEFIPWDHPVHTMPGIGCCLEKGIICIACHHTCSHCFLSLGFGQGRFYPGDPHGKPESQCIGKYDPLINVSSIDLIIWPESISTLIGIPMALVAWRALGIVISPGERVLPSISTTLLALLVPSFIVSVLIEYRVCRAFWRTIPERKTLTTVVIVNTCSYVLLLAIAGWGLA